jgi:hypothetical protein
MPHFENARIRDINQGTFVDVKGDAHVLMFTGGGLSGMRPEPVVVNSST